jgi:hypothetical protein
LTRMACIDFDWARTLFLQVACISLRYNRMCIYQIVIMRQIDRKRDISTRIAVDSIPVRPDWNFLTNFPIIFKETSGHFTFQECSWTWQLV